MKRLLDRLEVDTKSRESTLMIINERHENTCAERTRDPRRRPAPHRPARSRGAPSDATRGRTCVPRAGTCRRATSPTSTSSPSTTSTRGTSCGCAAKPAPSFLAPARRALARARSDAVSRRVHRRRSSSSRPPRWARCASVTARPSGLRGPTPPPSSPPLPFSLSPSLPILPPPSPPPSPNPSESGSDDSSAREAHASIDCALRLRCSRWEEECGVVIVTHCVQGTALDDLKTYDLHFPACTIPLG